MDIALIGPPGAGKGTQAAQIALKQNRIHMSSGNLFREHLRKQTALGILARRYMRQGALVPDEIVDAMMEERMRNTTQEQGIILDGFPGTEYQAQALDEFLGGMGRRLEAVIYLQIVDEELIYDRILGRRTCQTCHVPYHEKFAPFDECLYNQCNGENLYRRPDDSTEHVEFRMKSFYREVEPIISYYQRSNRLIVLDGEKSIPEVTETISVVIESLRQISHHRATIDAVQQIRRLRQIAKPLSPEEATHRSLDIVLLGAPGAGKGTQAAELSSRLELSHMATGNLFRKNIAEKTKLGLIAQGFIDQGDLVPDDVTQAMVRDRVSQPDTTRGFILDGFPRTVPQAEVLTDIMNELNRRIDAVLYVDVPDSEIIDRLSGRLICRKCQTPYHVKFNPPKEEGVCDVCGGELYQRKDDNPETIKARLRTFHQQTAPLADYYRELGLLIKVDGVGEIDDVVNRMMKATYNLAQTQPMF